VINGALRTKFYWSWAGEQSFTGLGLENKVLLVLGWRTGVHHEDCNFFLFSINNKYFQKKTHPLPHLLSDFKIFHCIYSFSE
jgi:hypothetical protein